MWWEIEEGEISFFEKQYKNTQMNDGKAVAEFFSILIFLTNQMKLCGKKITKL